MWNKSCPLCETFHLACQDVKVQLCKLFSVFWRVLACRKATGWDSWASAPSHSPLPPSGIRPFAAQRPFQQQQVEGTPPATSWWHKMATGRMKGCILRRGQRQGEPREEGGRAIRHFPFFRVVLIGTHLVSKRLPHLWGESCSAAPSSFSWWPSHDCSGGFAMIQRATPRMERAP